MLAAKMGHGMEGGNGSERGYQLGRKSRVSRGRLWSSATRQGLGRMAIGRTGANGDWAKGDGLYGLREAGGTECAARIIELSEDQSEDHRREPELVVVETGSSIKSSAREERRWLQTKDAANAGERWAAIGSRLRWRLTGSVFEGRSVAAGGREMARERLDTLGVDAAHPWRSHAGEWSSSGGRPKAHV
eukprot:5799752-Pleurochrysis_carterae.AAC.2